MLPIDEFAEFEGPDKKVKFKIIDGGIVLFGTNATRWLNAINDIAVKGVAMSIYFFHATAWSAAGEPSYRFLMNYRDGKQESLDMISGFNSRDWCQETQPLEDENSVWGWTVNEKPACNHAGAITRKWINPHPDTEIVSIDAISMGTWFCPYNISYFIG